MAGNGGSAGTAGSAGGDAAGQGGGGTAGGAGTAGQAGGGTAGMSGAAGGGGQPCGGYDEKCCPPGPMDIRGHCSNPDSSCKENVPDGPRCVQCGVPGANCCDGAGDAPRCASGCCMIQLRAAFCVAVGEECSTGDVCEADGTCGGCGGAGEACCQDMPEMPIWVSWCSANHTCVRNDLTQESSCELCGRQGQRCCDDPEDTFPVGHCVAPLECLSDASSVRRCMVP